MRAIICQDASGKVVGDTECASLHKISYSQTCNIHTCPTYTWQAGLFGACSVPCGLGERQRDVSCISSNGNLAVSEDHCIADEKPTVFQECTETETCAANKWRFGPWGNCVSQDPPHSLVTCGGGTRSRAVCCKGKDDASDCASDSRTRLADSACTGTKPADSQGCNQEACMKYTWSPCDYEECTATCGGGTGMLGSQSRLVRCLQNGVKVVDSSLCDVSSKPADMRDNCNSHKCTGLNWMADKAWGACVNGITTRTFHCHDKDGANANNASCVQVPLPLATLSCSSFQCPGAEPLLSPAAVASPGATTLLALLLSAAALVSAIGV